MADFSDREIEIIRSADIFASLSESTIHELLESASKIAFRQFETIYHPARSADFMFLILAGHVKLYHENKENRQTGQRVLGPGQVFAEEEFKAGKDYGEFAEAMAKLVVLVIDAQLYEQILQANIKKVAGLVDGLAEKLQELEDMSEIQRFDLALSTLAEVLYSEFLSADKAKFSPSMNPEELAGVTGISLEFLHQVLQELCDLEVIEVKGWEITVLDEEALRGLAGME